MQLNRITKFITITIFISGCATVPSSSPIVGSAVENFFSSPQNGKGVIYFSCGKWFTKSALLDAEDDLPACEFVINDRQYSQLKKGTVGKLELPKGKYSIKQAEGSMSVSIATSVELKESDVLLAVGEFTQKSGIGGGALSGNHVFSVTLSQISIDNVKHKKPVLMVPVN